MPRDAEVCDVTIILKKAYEERMKDAVDQLKKAGVEIRTDRKSVV